MLAIVAKYSRSRRSFSIVLLPFLRSAWLVYVCEVSAGHKHQHVATITYASMQLKVQLAAPHWQYLPALRLLVEVIEKVNNFSNLNRRYLWILHGY
jgi:hypothetical protein